MTYEIAVLFIILLGGLAFFSFEWLPVEVTALAMILLLVITGVMPIDLAFAGFGSETVMMMLGILILTAALNETGVSELLAQALIRGENIPVSRLLGLIMMISALLSAFMGNTATAAFFLPVVLGISNRIKVSSAKFLMPMAFAIILASSVTLVSTSTNVIVNGLMRQYDLTPMKMFELAPAGIPVLLVGLAYMQIIGQRLVPDRMTSEEVEVGMAHRLFVTELSIFAGSSLIGRSLDELKLMKDHDLAVLRVIRGHDRVLIPGGRMVLDEGDVLLVEGSREDLLRIVSRTEGVTLGPTYEFDDPKMDTSDIELVEVLILPGSQLVGRSLHSARLRDQYGLQILAVDHKGKKRFDSLSDIRLEAGDVLLIQGDPQSVLALSQEGTYHVLDRIGPLHQTTDRRWLALSIFVGAILLVSFNVLPIAVAMLGGGVLAFITRCITPEEAYNQIQWPILLLIGSMLGVGAAMQHTAAADFLATQIIALVPESSPRLLLTAFFILTVVFTQPMSNQAAAAIVFPVAIESAYQLGLNPRTFAMMIALAASTSFITPLEPACLLVYGHGRYRFFDFVKVGFPLTVVIYLIAIELVPIIWPL